MKKIILALSFVFATAVHAEYPYSSAYRPVPSSTYRASADVLIARSNVGTYNPRKYSSYVPSYTSRKPTYGGYAVVPTYGTYRNYGTAYGTYDNYGRSHTTFNNYGRSYHTINDYGSGGTTINSYGSGNITVNQHGTGEVQVNYVP